MGRIGADFQSLLPPIFEPQLVDIIFSHWQSGVEGLEKTLKVCREAGVASPLFDIMNTDSTEEGENENNFDPSAPSSSLSTPPPPRQLLSLPPLARFLNAFLTGLNELRRCLLPGTFPSLKQSFDEIVNEIKNVLEANDKLVHTPGLKGEAAKLREVAKEMKTQFEICLEPYCRTSLDVAFGCTKEDAGSNKDQLEEEKVQDEESENAEDSVKEHGAGEGIEDEVAVENEENDEEVKEEIENKAEAVVENEEKVEEYIEEVAVEKENDEDEVEEIERNDDEVGNAEEETNQDVSDDVEVEEDSNSATFENDDFEFGANKND